MATLYTQQSKNNNRTWLLMMAFFGLVVLIGFGLSYYFNDQGILIIAVLFSLVMNISAYWFSHKIVLTMHGAKPVTRQAMPELWNITENLSITAGIPMPKLYVINDPAPNAFATGRNKKHGVVVVTTGLLSILDRPELEGVIAHELAHIGNRDILIGTVAVVLAGFITIVADIFLRGHIFGGSDNKNNGGIVIIIAILLSIVAPIFATLLRLAISRKREFVADATGALLTRYPEGLARALKKIESYSHPLKTANRASAHLFISNPFARKSIGRLFSTHPSTESRIKALMQM